MSTYATISDIYIVSDYQITKLAIIKISFYKHFNQLICIKPLFFGFYFMNY